ncbi:MAG TPA: cupin domain-containing protein [Gaiellaceae bacterium]|jgi:mannose-6-phosphate isomerase-like protein (cupin superfamily)
MSEMSPNLLDLDRFAVEVKRVEKPWGYELVFAATDRYCGKVIFVRGGEEISLQFHRSKDETIYVQSGRVEFEIGDPGGSLDIEVVGPGRAFHIGAGTVHRVRALEDTVLLEVSTPETEDVVRLEDRYGRADL